MTCKLCRLVCLTVTFFAVVAGSLPRSASAMDTPNTLMGIDGMVLNAGGIFRDPGSFSAANGNDGFNTFQFGTFSINPPITTGYGKYDAFRFQKTAAGDCCISHNARVHSDTPETIDDPVNAPTTTRLVGDSITKDYLPIINRDAFGQQFDPSQYSVQVKFKPLLQQSTATSLGTNPYPSNPTYPPINAALENTATSMIVGLDSLGGYVWDASGSTYKRANEQATYTIGTAATPLNNLYASLPHDADGFATYSIPVTQPSAVGKGFYYGYGSGVVRDTLVTANGGVTQNPDSSFSDATVGFGANYQNFGGGPSDPNNPNSKLNVPNGVPLISFGGPTATVGLSLEIKSIALTKTNPTNLMARIDANSGVTLTTGSGFTYGATQPPITVNGTQYLPAVTDQISRFNASGMTNLTFNERTPDSATEVNKFLIRGEPSTVTFDATTATVNVRAKLTQPLTNAGIAQSLTIYARDRKGNDNAPNKGADEWDYVLPLNQFNTSSMTTVSIPMSAFTRNMNASALGAAPLGFANAGDGLLTNFGLYEFGGLIPAGGGLLKLEMEYMEMRTPSQVLAGDYNNNGFVDAADYTVWRDNLGKSVTLPGDTTPGTVVQADFDVWKNNFGAHAGSGSDSLSAGAVPEPATWLLGLTGLLGVAVLRRRKS